MYYNQMEDGRDIPMDMTIRYAGVISYTPYVVYITSNGPIGAVAEIYGEGFVDTDAFFCAWYRYVCIHYILIS